MPQLDFIIAFPQIFWLVIIFFSLYTSLVHFFLPNFIKFFKSRKYIVLENTKKLHDLQLDFTIKQKSLNLIIENNFNEIKIMLEKEISFYFKGALLIDWSLVDKKIANVLYHNILYYDINILEGVPLKINS